MNLDQCYRRRQNLPLSMCYVKFWLLPLLNVQLRTSYMSGALDYNKPRSMRIKGDRGGGGLGNREREKKKRSVGVRLQ